MSKTRTYALLTAVLAVAILAAGWFLLIAPQRAKAVEVRAQEVTAAAENDALRASIEQLKVQAADLPAQEARLAVLRQRFPDTEALPALVRDLTDAGKAAGISLESVAPGVAVPLIPAAAVAPVAPPAPPAEGTEGVDAAAPAPAAPVAPASALLGVPVTLTALGGFTEMNRFINELEELDRSFLVTGFTLTNPESDSGGRILELSLTGSVFVIATPTSPTALTPVAPVTTPAPAAAPSASAPAN